MVYLTYYAFASMSSAVSTQINGRTSSLEWKAVPVESETYKHFTELLTSKRELMTENTLADKLAKTGNKLGEHPWCSPTTIAANIALLIVTLAWSIFWYYSLNFLDWALCQTFGWELCVKVWSWQQDWDMNVYYFNNQTDHQSKYLLKHWNQLGSWLLPWQVPSFLNIDHCPFRLWGMILVTWLCAWLLFCYWRLSLMVAVKETAHRETVARVDHYVASGFGVGEGGTQGATKGMFTSMLDFAFQRNRDHL